jgi:hypothetical protein
MLLRSEIVVPDPAVNLDHALTGLPNGVAAITHESLNASGRAAGRNVRCDRGV